MSLSEIVKREPKILLAVVGILLFIYGMYIVGSIFILVSIPTILKIGKSISKNAKLKSIKSNGVVKNSNSIEIMKYNSVLDNIGRVLAIFYLIGVIGISFALMFAMAHISIILIIMFGLFIFLRRERLKAMIMSKGFGIGVIIYTVWIACIPLILINVEHLTFEVFLKVLVIGIVGLFVLPRFSANAKKAAPFMIFLLTIGVLALKIESMSSNNDNSNLATDNNSSNINTDVGAASAAAAATFANTTNFDNTNVNVADTSSSFGDFSTGTNTVNMDTVNSNVNPTMTTDTNVDYNNYTTSTANTDFNTPEPKSTTTYQYTDGNNNFNVNMQADGSGTITSDDNQPMGTVEQKGNTTIVKDENGNVISTEDNINGFVYDDKGMPQGIVDDNKSVNSYYDVNSGNNTVEANGHIIDSEGNQGTIKKK